MNKAKKAAIIAASILLTGALGAAAAPPIAVNYAMQTIADNAGKGKKLEDTLNESLEADPEFVAIIPRLQLTEPYGAIDSVGEFEKTFEEFPEPMGDLYKSLPGVQNFISHLKQRDAEEARMVANKTIAKVYAHAEARRICYIVKESTPSHIVTHNNEKIKLNDPDNLAAYLDYCGGDAASYKDALSAVVVQREM
jgi:hypothetical protein